MSGSRTKGGFRSILTVALFLAIALGLFLFLERQKKLKQEQDHVPQAQNRVGHKKHDAVQSSQDPMQNGEKNDDDDSEYHAVANCNPEDSNPRISVSHERFLNLLREGQVWVPATRVHSCYKEGVSVALVSHRAEGNIVYETVLRGRVRVEKIEDVSLNQISTEKKYLVDADEKQAIARALRRRTRRTGEEIDQAKFKFLLLKKESWLESRRNYGVPMTHPMARTINLDEFKASLAKGEIPYDVRPLNFFKAKTITGATNAPANIFNNTQFILHSPSELAEMKFRINIVSLPKDKDAPLIVFSSCAADFLSYNAITYLRQTGYRDIRWFRGGLENWVTNGRGCGTPNQLTGLPIVDGVEARKHLDKKTKFIFVHGGFNLRKYVVKGSLQLEYRQKYRGDLMAAFRPVSLADFGEKFAASGDETAIDSLNLDPSTPIVVYGRNEFDWKPLKVAYLLQSKGFKNVSWYRVGIEDWLNHALYKTAEFPTTPNYVRE